MAILCAEQTWLEKGFGIVRSQRGGVRISGGGGSPVGHSGASSVAKGGSVGCMHSCERLPEAEQARLATPERGGPWLQVVDLALSVRA